MSYMVAKDECTIAELRDYRVQAREMAIARALTLGVAGSREELCARQFLNIIDGGCAAEQWNTAALAVLGTQYTVFQAAAPVTMANNKVAVFFGAACRTVPVPISRITVRSGGIAGNIIHEFDYERVVQGQTIEGFFGQPVVIDPTVTFDIQVTASIATGVLARVVLFNWLIEPIGQTIA